MSQTFNYSYAGVKSVLEEVLNNGYKVITCHDYIALKKNKLHNQKLLINRVDVDVSCRKAKILAEIFNSLNIKGSFFIRLHADSYNPFSFENYKCLKYIRDTGHEIGYHSEIIDQSVIWNENAEKCLLKDVNILNELLAIKITGVASHGGITGLNNLDFWKTRKASEFGLLYEAYDTQPEFNLFHESLYVSDSHYRWNCYKNGILMLGVHKPVSEHAKDGHPIIYSLMHDDAYCNVHIYEDYP